MDSKEDTVVYSDGYWEEQVKAAQALAKTPTAAGTGALFFWGMCLVTGLAIAFGPSVLALAGLL